MKISIFSAFYPFRGGIAQFNARLVRSLEKENEVTAFTFKKQYPNFLFPGSSQFEKSGSAPLGIKIHTILNTINPFNWLMVARFIRKQKPDFILFRYWLPFFGPCLGTIGKLVKSHTKVLALTDNIIPHEKRIGDHVFTKYFVKNCDGFIAMSKVVLNDLSIFTQNLNKAYSPHPMYENYGDLISIDLARKKLNLNPHDKIILFFGLIRHYKGLDILLEALAAPEIKNQGVKLLIAGEFYDDKNFYLQLIKKLKLQDHVIVHDKFIPNDEVRDYFCASNLVAQTYRNATNSGVTMVGYFYEKPMLVTNVGGLSEIVPNEVCGYVVENNCALISEKVVDFFTKDREKEFVKNVKIEKKKYEWIEFINSLLTLYNRC